MHFFKCARFVLLDERRGMLLMVEWSSSGMVMAHRR
jgi:hypothetical protein